MSLRLVGRVGDRDVELFVGPGRCVLGSGSGSDLVLSHATVSRNHAELRLVDEGLEVLDLGSRNGTWVGGRRIHQTIVKPGHNLRFGQVQLRLEEVSDADREPALSLGPTGAAAEPHVLPGDEATTVSYNPFRKFTERTLTRALEALRQHEGLIQTAQIVGQGLLEAAPAGQITVLNIGEHDGALWRGSQELAYTDGQHTVAVEHTPIRVVACFATATAAETYSSLLEVGAGLIALASGQDPPSGPPQPPPLPCARPEPPTVVAEMGRLYDEAAKVATTDVGVLISGESGTGKEVLARFIHLSSPRAQGPFIALNCAALPRDLLETELFGIEKGVATGVEKRRGRFEQADGGTLFLDEIGDMARETQAMILRTLQEGEVYRIGASAPRKVSVRIIAATNRDVEEIVEEGQFREDLYYRVATWTAHLPPLRQRRDDIVNLAAYFLARSAGRLGRSIGGISRGAVDALLAYDWPGNVRQLENEMARAVAFVPDGGMLDTSRLRAEIVAGPRGEDLTTPAERLQRCERREILRALRALGFDTAAVAKALGMSRSTLYRHMKMLGIEGQENP